MKMLSSEKEGLKKILSYNIDSESKRLFICLAATFFFGMLAHAYGFLNLTISDDSLYEFTLPVTTAWKLKLGRFMQPLLRYCMGEVITLPWLTGVTGLMFAGLAVHFMSKMFRLDQVWENIVLSGVCVTNVTVIVVIATFIHDFCGDMCSLFLSVYAAYVWSQMKRAFSWKKTLLGSIAIVGSLGFYQTYLAVTITLIIIDTIQDLLNGETWKEAIISMLRAIPMGVCAVLVYFVCIYFSLHLTRITFTTGYDLGNSMSLKDLKWPYILAREHFYPKFDREHWLFVTQAVFENGRYLICTANIVLLITSVYTGISLVVKKKVKLQNGLFILVLIALLPFTMLCVGAITGWFHEVTRYAMCLFYLVVLVFMRQCNRTGRALKNCFLPFVLILAVIISNIQMANVVYVKKNVEREATLSKMTRVLSLLDKYEGYDPEISSCAIIGWENEMPYMAVGEIDEWMGTSDPEYTSQITYRESLVKYIQTMLNVHINLCSIDEEIELAETEEFREMDKFPAKGCIATINDVIVIKLMDDPFANYYGTRDYER